MRSRLLPPCPKKGEREKSLESRKAGKPACPDEIGENRFSGFLAFWIASLPSCHFFFQFVTTGK